MLEAGCEGRGP